MVIDIKQIRAKLGLTQQQFAGLLGISMSTVANWEADPPRSQPSKLAQARLQEIIRSIKVKAR